MSIRSESCANEIFTSWSETSTESWIIEKTSGLDLNSFDISTKLLVKAVGRTCNSDDLLESLKFIQEFQAV